MCEESLPSFLFCSEIRKHLSFLGFGEMNKGTSTPNSKWKGQRRRRGIRFQSALSNCLLFMAPSRGLDHFLSCVVLVFWAQMITSSRAFIVLLLKSHSFTVTRMPPFCCFQYIPMKTAFVYFSKAQPASP